MRPGSAAVGAGVKHHICYLPSNAPSTSGYSSTPLGAAHEGVAPTHRIGVRRAKQTEEEKEMEKERKILALAETLRTHIPAAACDSRRQSKDESRASCNEQSAAPTAALDATVSSTDPPDVGPDSEEAESTAEKEAPQCIVFADSHEEVRPLTICKLGCGRCSRLWNQTMNWYVVSFRCATLEIIHCLIPGAPSRCTLTWTRLSDSKPCGLSWKKR